MPHSLRHYPYLLLLLVAFAAALLSILPVRFAFAQDERETVRVDGRGLFRVGPLEDIEASERARQIEQRIATLLENPPAISPATVEISGTERLVTVSGVPVVTVTEEDAQANLTSQEALANLWAQRIDTALQAGRERRLSPRDRFVAEVRGAVETAFARTLESLITVVPRLLAALVVLGFFWIVAALVRWLMRLFFSRVAADLTIENLIRQLSYYAVWVLGLIVAVDALGFDPQTVVTGLGLTGLALGFALKDIISNFVSGILILTLRPFHLGDQIVIGETEGNVERIELRATQIRTYDGRVVLVPNAEVFTSRVTNNTAAPVRRGSVAAFLGYGSDVEQAVNVVRRATETTAGVLVEPAVGVLVCDLGPEAVMIEVLYWTDSRRADFLATESAVRQSIVDALRAAGIGLPEPNVRVLVPRQPERWATMWRE